jgi:microcystin-dependent protein
MAQKKITDLQLISSVTASQNMAVDDGIQTYRATMAQLKTFVLSAGSVDESALTSALQALLVQPGTVITSFASSAPTGYLACDGSAVSRTTYADLYAAIGDSCGEGDGSTTFNLPDLRGRFLRGVDDGEGNDPNAGSRTAMATGGNTGDNVGSIQSDEFGSHYHREGGANQGVLSSGHNFYGTEAAGLGTKTRSDGGAASTSIATLTQTVGGDETRPKNVNVLFYIKT